MSYEMRYARTSACWRARTGRSRAAVRPSGDDRRPCLDCMPEGPGWASRRALTECGDGRCLSAAGRALDAFEDDVAAVGQDIRALDLLELRRGALTARWDVGGHAANLGR